MSEATIAKSELFSIRDYLPEDLHFILSTWLRGLFYNSNTFRGIDKKSFFQHYEPVLRRLIASSRGRIACLVEDPSVILGYAFYEIPKLDVILHYIYVKQAFRRIGIAKDLMPMKINQVTHLTLLGQKILESHFKHIKFDPFRS